MADGLQPRRPLHITINSGSGGDILESMQTDGSLQTPATPGTPGFTRQLLPPQRRLTGGQSSRLPYGSPGGVLESSENLLLPPSRSRGPRPYQDSPPEQISRTTSAMSSRRTSWSSQPGSRESLNGPFASPFDDSRAPSRAGSDDEAVNTQTVSEKYNIMPSAGLLLFPEDVEKDDWLHNPDENDKDREKCDVWNKRGITNVGGLVLVTLGVLVLFVGYPALYGLLDCEINGVTDISQDLCAASYWRANHHLLN